MSNERLIKTQDNILLRRRVERFITLLEKDMNIDYKNFQEGSEILLSVFTSNSFIQNDLVSYMEILDLLFYDKSYKFEVNHPYISSFIIRKDVAILIFAVIKNHKNKRICC